MVTPSVGEIQANVASAEASLMSRRTFFRAIAATAIGVCVGNELMADDKPQPTATPGRETINLGHQEASWGYGDDASTAVKTIAVETGSVLLAKAVHVNVGNAGISKIAEQAAKRPIDWAVQTVVVAPTVEELAFRFVPSTLADIINPAGKGNRRWALGALSSLAFAGVHNLGQETKTLPAPQLISGFVNWYVQRRAGFKHAAITHAVHNGILYPGILAIGKNPKLRKEDG